MPSVTWDRDGIPTFAHICKGEVHHEILMWGHFEWDQDHDTIHHKIGCSECGLEGEWDHGKWTAA